MADRANINSQILRSPLRGSLEILAAGVTMTAAGILLFVLGATGTFGTEVRGPFSDQFAMIVGSIGGVFFAVCSIIVVAALCFSPQRCAMEIAMDDDVLCVRWGLGHTAIIAWDDVMNLTVSGPQEPISTASLTLLYRSADTSKVSTLRFPMSTTRIEPTVLRDIFIARLEADPQYRDNS